MLPPVSDVFCNQIRSYLTEHQGEMVALLMKLVAAESPSDVPKSQRIIQTLLTEFLQRLDYKVQRVAGQRSGGNLIARPRSAGDSAVNQLLVGHCDTVWPLGTISTMPIERNDGILRGPGVYDMKCGLAQKLYALQAIHDLGLRPKLAPVVFINSDEELGSSESRSLLVKLAQSTRRAFVLEPSLGPTGKLKTARKGVGRFTILVEGRAAHAGLDPGAGASAIAELAVLIQQLFALNAPDVGTTVNVGMIEGGVRPNVVAPRSKAVVDVRVLTVEEGQRVETAIRALRPTTKDTTIEVQGGIDRPPMEKTSRNQELWTTAQQLGQQLGLDLEEGTAGGGSDGNLTSLHTATLDGLGGVGDGAHAAHEFIRIEELANRSSLLALLLLAPE